jgi:hypothetical protein
MRRLGFAATVVGIVGLLMGARFVRLAHATGPTTCTVSNVSYQPAFGGGAAVPVDLLLINCGGNGYLSYVADATHPVTNGGCYASATTVQNIEAVALTARTTGNPLTLFYTGTSCPGNAGAKIINFVQM